MLKEKKKAVPSAKVAVVGLCHSGKSPLITRYVDNTYSDAYDMTIGAHFSRTLATIENKEVRLDIWDISGLLGFLSRISMYLKNADAVMIVFSVTQRDSFEAAKSYLDAARKEGPSDVYILLVGNKCDIMMDGDGDEKRVVEYVEAEAFARENDLPYIETSAKEGTNVNEAFNMIAKEKLRKLGIDPENPRESGEKSDSSSCSLF